MRWVALDSAHVKRSGQGKGPSGRLILRNQFQGRTRTHDTLLEALKPYFPLHRTRLHLMVQLLCAMLTLGTVRLPRLATYLESSGHTEAHSK